MPQKHDANFTYISGSLTIFEVDLQILDTHSDSAENFPPSLGRAGSTYTTSTILHTDSKTPGKIVWVESMKK